MSEIPEEAYFLVEGDSCVMQLLQPLESLTLSEVVKTVHGNVLIFLETMTIDTQMLQEFGQLNA